MPEAGAKTGRARRPGRAHHQTIALTRIWPSLRSTCTRDVLAVTAQARSTLRVPEPQVAQHHLVKEGRQ